MIWIGLFFALSPADLAPGAQELAAAELRFQEVFEAAEATGAAVTQLQSRWAGGAAPKDVCDDHDRLALGWRIERFGAAWRESAQALRVQAARLRALQAAPTVAPLVAGDAGLALGSRLEAADALVARFIQGSAWEVAYVRPILAACPIAGAGLDDGVNNPPLRAKAEGSGLVAVLASGDGVVCPGAVRADDAVVLLKGGQGCWAPDATCACEPRAVFPGAVLGPPIVEGEAAQGGE
ncbi:hypothetical protein LBMAG42_48620 [Deltaproteobacteria bacterium]|nr:hypothetical protein LBMAG42_48620 [Deltaproteobacteria bacterium]